MSYVTINHRTKVVTLTINDDIQGMREPFLYAEADDAASELGYEFEVVSVHTSAKSIQSRVEVLMMGRA